MSVLCNVPPLLRTVGSKFTAGAPPHAFQELPPGLQDHPPSPLAVASVPPQRDHISGDPRSPAALNLTGESSRQKPQRHSQLPANNGHRQARRSRAACPSTSVAPSARRRCTRLQGSCPALPRRSAPVHGRDHPHLGAPCRAHRSRLTVASSAVANLAALMGGKVESLRRQRIHAGGGGATALTARAGS